MLKISVITTTYNSASTIEDTLKSVIEQDYPNVEYIIIDGLSKDNTLEIVNKYKDKIAKIISEKDSGIYDALNKGVNAATGDIIALLHSDDFYMDKTVLSKVVAEFEKTKADSVYGNLYYVHKDNTNKTILEKEQEAKTAKSTGDSIYYAAFDLDIKNPTKPEEEHEYNSAELMEMLHASFEKSNTLLNQLKQEVKLMTEKKLLMILLIPYIF